MSVRDTYPVEETPESPPFLVLQFQDDPAENDFIFAKGNEAPITPETLELFDSALLTHSDLSGEEKHEQSIVRGQRTHEVAAESVITGLGLSAEELYEMEPSARLNISHLVRVVSRFNRLYRRTGIIEALPPASSLALHQRALVASEYRNFLVRFAAEAEKQRRYFQTTEGRQDPAAATPVTRFLNVLPLVNLD